MRMLTNDIYIYQNEEELLHVKGVEYNAKFIPLNNSDTYPKFYQYHTWYNGWEEVQERQYVELSIEQVKAILEVELQQANNYVMRVTSCIEVVNELTD